MSKIRNYLVLLACVVFLTPLMADIQVGSERFNPCRSVEVEDPKVMALSNNERAESGSNPHRDDLGDIIDEINVGEGTWGGITWDGVLMWGVDYDGSRMVGVNPQGEIVEEVELPCEELEVDGFWSLCWDGEVFWAGCEEFVELFRFDRDGNLLGRIEVPGDGEGGVSSITFDGENLWYWIPENESLLRQVTREGELVREVDCSEIGLHEQGSDYWALAWIPEHGDFNMWALVGEEGFLCQLNLEGNQAEVMAEVDIEHGEVYGLSHDGTDLWYPTCEEWWYVIDDGIEEDAEPVIVIDPNAIEDNLNTGDVAEHVVNVSNDGDAVLRFSIEDEIIAEPERDRRVREVRKLRNDDQAGPCRDNLGDIIDELFVGEGFITGLGWDGELMWGVDYEGGRLVGGNFDREGQEIELTFEDLDVEGFTGLCWDGATFWLGCVEQEELYNFDTDGNWLGSFELPAGEGEGAFSLTWDGVHLWYLRGDIRAGSDPIMRQVSVEGELIRSVDIQHIVENSNSDYWCMVWVPEHADGQMWLLGGEQWTIHQLNVEGEQAEIVQEADINHGDAMFYGVGHDGSNLWYCDEEGSWWVMDDGIEEINWLSYEPDEGELEPGAEMDVTVTLNAADLEDGDYEAELNFLSNDPDNEEIIVSVTMNVGIQPRELEIAFEQGWNMISINVTPDEELWEREEGPDIVRMLEQLRIDEENHHIELFKNGTGLFYVPAFDFNNIPFWNLTEGYQAKVDEDVEAVWSGAPIPADADIPLTPGWNMIAYFPTYQLDASAPDFYVLSPIIDNVILAKDSRGDFMAPPFNFSNMLPWCETHGYQVKIEVEEPIVLNYPPEQEEGAAMAVAEPIEGVAGHWTAPLSTGENMIVLVVSVSGVKLTDSDQIAAFSSDGLLVGVGTVDKDSRCGIAIWGDDRSTDVVDGLVQGEAFELRLWNADRATEETLEVTTIAGGFGPVYETDGFVAFDAAVKPAIPDEFYLSQNYPNPFNSLTRLAYGLPEAADVTIRVYDVTGRLVAELIDSEVTAGNYITIWDAKSSAAGIYLVRMEVSTGFSSIRKVILVK